MLFGKIDESCTLTKGMATRLGLNIGEAVQSDPEFDALAFRSAVLKCMGCKEHDACKTLQATHDSLETAPDYCRNW